MIRAVSRVASLLVPLAGLAVLLAVLVGYDPLSDLTDPPPTEEVAFERAVLSDGEVELHIRNDGPDDVTIAQVLVNEAYWQHDVDDRVLGRLDAATVRISYPWEEGLPLAVTLVSSTGTTFEHEIELASATPEPDAGSFGRYALVGLAIGVVPVALGLLWLPSLRRLPGHLIGAALAFTVGLLAFLLVDTVDEGLDMAGQAPEVLGGVELFGLGALLVVVALVVIEQLLMRDRLATADAGGAGLAFGYLVAAGIGLHNLGEGLAVGASAAVGEVALGTALVIGFAVHNLTEGLAIASPLAEGRGRLPWRHLVALVAVAGLPTVPGAWLGAFAFSPAWAALAFGVAAGAIAQVIWAVGRHLMAIEGGRTPAAAGAFAAALGVMYFTGLAVI